VRSISPGSSYGIEGGLLADACDRRCIDSASAELHEILRNAYNLWLVIHLLDDGVAIDWLQGIQSEVQLFEGYWHYRISARHNAHDRLALVEVASPKQVFSSIYYSYHPEKLTALKDRTGVYVTRLCRSTQPSIFQESATRN
jgi:hypothetical protein